MWGNIGSTRSAADPWTHTPKICEPEDMFELDGMIYCRRCKKSWPGEIDNADSSRT